MDTDADIIRKIVANIRFIHQRLRSLAKDIASLHTEQRAINRDLGKIKAQLDRLSNADDI